MKRWITPATTAIGCIASIVAIWVFLTGRSTLLDDNVSPAILRSPWLGLQSIQNGHHAEASQVDERTIKVRLKAAPFEIRLPKKGTDDDYRLCAWTDGSIFSEIRKGVNLDDTRCFGVGTGLADSPYTSATLFLANDGHNVLASERLGPDPTVHSAYYSSVSIDGKEYKLSDYAKTIYIVALSDQNEDRVIDNIEYEFIILEF